MRQWAAAVVGGKEGGRAAACETVAVRSFSVPETNEAEPADSRVGTAEENLLVHEI